jgi:hypothetical protein
MHYGRLGLVTVHSVGLDIDTYIYEVEKKLLILHLLVQYLGVDRASC